LGASSSGYFGASSSGYFTASSSGYVGSSSGTVASSSSSGFVGSSGGRVEGVPGCAGATCDYSPGMLQLIPSGAGIAFSDGCYQSSVGIGGYAYPVADTQGSTACVVATQLCGIGTTAAYIPGSLAWGSGMGVNVGQAAASGVNGVVTPTAAGLSYAISQLPADGLRIELGTAGPSYCYQIQADAFGTIPWSSFVTDCWDAVPTGATFSPSIGIADVQFIVPAGAAASSWDFCVQSLSF
jgi:hypothetical protein